MKSMLIRRGGLWVLAAGLACAVAVPAFAARLSPTSRMVRIEGYWTAPVPDEDSAWPDAAPEKTELPDDEDLGPIGRLNLATSKDGRTVRPFAVTAVRAYQGFDGGMEVFHKACVRPAVNLRGRDEVLAQMTAMADGEPVTFYAQFATGSSELLVTNIELPEEE